MLFHTAVYALFLPTVLALYHLLGLIRQPVRRVRTQNLLLLAASYFFYGWWDWRFVGLIVLSSAIDYAVGLGLEATNDARRRRLILAASLVGNLGILGFFKYYDFFVSSLVDALAALGIAAHAPTLRVILPVGLSFYTFQALTYTVGVYRRQLPAERDPITFFAYVAFFPQLVAGPIERAPHMLPQFTHPRHVSAGDFSRGLRQITWGLYCKLVVADNCAQIVNAIFDGGHPVAGSVALLGAFFFAFQIYGDFSGYSHIALGSARLFGFELMQNFATPYFSRSIPEFWHRWHISLSTWFRDFVFIPLGGSRVSKARYARNILITFTASGLWHGANWTFVVWGFLNGLYYLPRIFLGPPSPSRASVGAVRILRTAAGVLTTFLLTLLAWIFFRAKTVGEAVTLIASIFSPSIAVDPLPVLRSSGLLTTATFAGLAIAVMCTLEFMQRDKGFALDFDARKAPAARWTAYASVVALIVCLRYTGSALDFIYFQF
jgi:D-alanyl-lipoteichoic acid acyltransferase DltB (MBOAT superfamily)